MSKVISKLLEDLIERVTNEADIAQVPSTASTIVVDSCDEGEEDVQAVVDKQIRNGRAFYLLKWRGYNDSHNTWHDVKYLSNCIPLVREFERRLMREFIDLEATTGCSKKRRKH